MVNIIPYLRASIKEPIVLLVVDLFGAMATSFTMLFLLASERLLTGLPSWLLYSMGLIALGFACIDAAAILRFFEASIALAAIAFLNLGYCVMMLIALFVYRASVTELCWVYCCVEIAIVIPLACWELKIAKQ